MNRTLVGVDGVSCCWWSEVLREEITTNLEMIHVVYWQVMQHLIGICPAWEEPENNRSKNKKAESSEQSCQACRALIWPFNSIFVRFCFHRKLLDHCWDKHRSSVFLEGTVASETELATAGKYNTALKALKIDSAASILNSSTGLV